jgi:hypothetical protein
LKIWNYAIIIVLALTLTPPVDSQSAAGVRAPIVDARPLAEASIRLQEVSGKIVTYEEPILTWSGDLEELPGKSGSKGYLYPKSQSFIMPEVPSVPDLASALNQVLDAYHKQTSGTRFQFLSSKAGYHIVPRQVHDAKGALVASASLLDANVTIAQIERTPQGHLAAFAAAVVAATGTRLDLSAIPFKPHGFDDAFRARPERFSWGAQSMVARDALIDLLNRSATSFSWRLKCQASAQPDARFCVLNLGPVAVAITDSNGKPDTRPLWFDRCVDCPALQQVLPAARPGNQQ